MLFSFVLLISGIALLVVAGDLFVKGAISLAEMLGISPLVIGLTVVAFGTSAPELFVSLEAAIGGVPGIALGNVIGSNIANILLVIGLPALIAPVCAHEKGIRRNVTFMVSISLLFMWFLSDGTLSRFEGALLFGLLIFYVLWQMCTAAAQRSESCMSPDYQEEIGNTPKGKLRIGTFIIAGICGLPIGAYLTIQGAMELARVFDVSETAIGLTGVALGTSLPELAVSLMAAIRGKSAMALGNVIGSNIFNIACIMGITAMIVPLSVPDRIVAIDIWVMLAVSLMMAVLAFGHLTARKILGGAMTTAFAVYVISIF